MASLDDRNQFQKLQCYRFLKSLIFYHFTKVLNVNFLSQKKIGISVGKKKNVLSFFFLELFPIKLASCRGAAYSYHKEHISLFL